MHISVKYGITIAISLTTVYLCVKYIEKRSMFFPSTDITMTPEDVNIPFEDIYLKTKDGIKLNVWFVPSPNAKYTILFCHGNAGNISHRIEKIAILRRLGLNVFIVDYRGYGKSGGHPSEKGLYTDVESAYDHVVDNLKINSKNIILYGESLGCGAAVYLAGQRKVKAVILEGGFSSVRDVARKYYPYIPSFLITDRFNSLSRIEKVTAAKLFMHSKNDEIIPFELAVKLYNSAPQPKDFAELIGGHNTAFMDSKKKYMDSIFSFIKRNS